MNVDLPGVTIGHWTDRPARTGCTVIRLSPAAVASGEVRGGAPATREFELLDPTRHVERVDAIVLSGGSAFGLAAADGVTAALADAGVGFATAHGPVPIVVAMSLYDLGVGDPSAYPNAASGQAALQDASNNPSIGAVGAGAGATVGKWRGPAGRRDAGFAIEVLRDGALVVVAAVAVNAAGDIDDGQTVSAAKAGEPLWPSDDAPFGNTVIGAVLTNAKLDKTGCLVVAQGGHDGLARAVMPPHMRADGDAFVAASTGVVEAPLDHVRLMAVVATETAIRSSVDTLSA